MDFFIFFFEPIVPNRAVEPIVIHLASSQKRLSDNSKIKLKKFTYTINNITVKSIKCPDTLHFLPSCFLLYPCTRENIFVNSIQSAKQPVNFVQEYLANDMNEMTLFKVTFN